MSVNVVITLAGKSQRFEELGFKKPKAFLNLGGKTIIENVVEMFSPKDHFTFIINKNQINYLNFLENICPNSKTVVIDPHDKGPVFSVKQINHIGRDEEVIISYCDFLVEWDYEHFLSKARNFHGAIPIFKNFHPASFGKTRYAYIQEEDGIFKEISEKKSYTPDHVSEPASAGIYYFSKFSTFLNYADQLLKTLPEEKEGYISLLYNLMRKDGLNTITSEVFKFICLGTPSDYLQYKDWETYFANKLKKERSLYPGQINLIPMAGKGQRFKDEGYEIKKPFIPVGNSAMSLRCFRNLPMASDWIFIHSEGEKFSRELESESFKYLSFPGESGSMGETCLLAKDLLKEDKSLFISSADYETYFDEEKWRRILDDPTIDGAIWSYKYKHHVVKDPKNFAYLELAGDRVCKVVEKETISDTPSLDPLVVGCFWYRNSTDFTKGIESLILEGKTVGSEYYVGTSINKLIEMGKTFISFEIDFWVSFGDPHELKIFEYWEDFFKKRNSGKPFSHPKREWQASTWA